MKKATKYIGLTVILVAVITGFSLFYSRSVDESKVKVGYISSATAPALPVYVIQHYSLFEKAGIDYELVPFQSSNLAFEAVVRGDVDIVPNISSIPILNAQLVVKDQLKVFSVNEFSKDPGDAVIVLIDSPITSLKDLEGKNIGVFPGSTATSILKAQLLKEGLDINKVTITALAPNLQLPALQAKSIDALYSYEPSTSIAITEGYARKIKGSLYTEAVQDTPFGWGIVSINFVNNHKSLSKKTIAVFKEANDFAQNEEDVTRGIIIEKGKVPEAAAKLMFITPYKFGSDINQVNINEFTEWLVNIGELKTKPDVSNLFYK